LIHVLTQNQLADIFTRLWGELGVCLVSWVSGGSSFVAYV
jgi:hypothetical protein